MLTERQREVLTIMRDHREDDEGELLYERGTAYLGHRSISTATVFALLRLCAISMNQYSRVGGLERYTINETGLNLLAEGKQ